ncbi:UNVERIFIED_CONTAM: hypothetical protein Slati_2958000 [Sesamum latifolium]|uniref:DUF4218 domain-containing protein n=1 Tax=Sesamum latifolium TaxID=2727402 RepID=A0AAW2VI02_9LAMI
MLDVIKVQELEASVTTILCNLEKIFPPAFFDSMEHLIVHLPYEARVEGPVQYRWMYPFERPRRNDDFCMNDTRIRWSIFNYPSRASGASKKRWLSQSKRHIINAYILTNYEVVATLRGPTAEVTIFLCYFVNSYNFHTEHHSIGKSIMNYGVSIKSSSYTDTDSDFYGILEEIIQLDYPLIPNMQIVLFKCHWVDPFRGMNVRPHYHLVDVNFKKVYQKNKSFILAQQAVQDYYMEYPNMKRDKVDWKAVYKNKARRVIDDSRWTEVAFQEYETIPTPQVVTDNHSYELHDLNGIQLVVELSVANQQGASTSRSTNVESDDESDEHSFDEDYKTEEDNNYD